MSRAGRSSNGRTPPFEGGYLGSNPSLPALRINKAILILVSKSPSTSSPSPDSGSSVPAAGNKEREEVPEELMTKGMLQFIYVFRLYSKVC